VKNTERSGSKGGSVRIARTAAPGGFDTQQLNLGISNETAKQADRVRSTADAGDSDVRETGT
jgi:hypothetical protein